MRRSAGITISAVLVFIGCGLTLLWSVLLLLAFVVTPAADSTPAFVKYVSPVLVLLMLAFAGWGIATGLNLLRLREWARISMLVFCGLLLLLSVPTFLLMLVKPLPVPAAPAMPPGVTIPQLERIMTAARVGLAVLYGLLAALGGWWMYFFNVRSTRDQFRGSGMAALHRTPAETAAALAPASPKRPVSITIIAYLALVGACSFPVLQLLHLPIAFLGFYYTGWKSSLIVSGFMAVQLAMAFGLLKLEPWGRSLAVYYFNFAIFNSIISVILPGAQSRYEQTANAMQVALGLPPSPVQFPIWSTLVLSLPLIVIQLWFVVTRRQAFEHPRQSSSLQ